MSDDSHFPPDPANQEPGSPFSPPSPSQPEPTEPTEPAEPTEPTMEVHPEAERWWIAIAWIIAIGTFLLLKQVTAFLLYVYSQPQLLLVDPERVLSISPAALSATLLATPVCHLGMALTYMSLAFSAGPSRSVRAEVKARTYFTLGIVVLVIALIELAITAPFIMDIT